MPQQVPELILDHPEAARLLTNVAFLSRFVEPTSPSEAARQLGMAANLAHHHAQHAVRVGALFEAGRTSGRVLYQLTARRFKVSRAEADALSSRETSFDRSIRQLSSAYLEAHHRSEAHMTGEQGRWSVYTFGRVDEPALPVDQGHSDEPHPALLMQRTVKLTPEQYRRLLLHLRELILQEASNRDDPRAATCTVAMLGFEGAAHKGLSDDTQSYSHFFTPTEEQI